MARKKINWLLILQGWAMLWVVIGHSPLSLKNMPEWVELLFNIAYSFHMPLFILVSGYLFQMTRLIPSELNFGGDLGKYKSIIRDKLVRLGIPFLVFTAVAMIVKVLNPGEVSRQTAFSIAEFTKAIANPFEGPNNEMWFIMTILWFFALAPMWQLACKKWYTEVALILILLVLHFIYPNTNWLSIRFVCHHAIYFYSGILICKHGLENKCQNLRWWLLIIGALIYAISIRKGVSFLATWCGIAFSAGLAFILDEYLPKTFCGFRNYTYQIFLMGIFVQIAVKIIYRHVHIPYVVGYIVCLLLGLYVPVIISKIIEKLNWKPLLLCIGLKKK